MAKAILGFRDRQALASRVGAASPSLPLPAPLALTPETGYSLIDGWLFNHFTEKFWPFQEPDAPLVLCEAVDYRPLIRVMRRYRRRRRRELRRTNSPERKRYLREQLSYVSFLLAAFAEFAGAMRDLDERL